MRDDLVVACSWSDSDGAKRLAALLECQVWRGGPVLDGTAVVNWGHSNGLADITLHTGAVLNRTYAVYNGIWKRRSYRLWQGRSWALERLSEQEASLLRRHGTDVLLRTDGLQQGSGIQLWDGEPLLDRQFLVAVYPQTHEWRVHVCLGEAFGVTQKKPKQIGGATSDLIRSYANGWMFSSYNMVVNDFTLLHKAAIEAVALLGMDFGAVDLMSVVRNDKIVDVKVCEVNSAPGLELISSGAPYPSYAKRIVRWYNQLCERGICG